MKLLYKLLLLVFAFLVDTQTHAQGENNIWTFGRGYSLDFNHNPPLLKDTTYWNGTTIHGANAPLPSSFNYNRSSAVCDANGNLLFIVKCIDAQSSPNTPNIFDRNENPIVGTNFLYDGGGSDAVGNKIPTIVPHPGNPNQYYIFYVRNRGLLYSLFDMSLNNGLGNVVPGYHNILISNYNTVLGGVMTTVQGCDGVWLIARHYVYNQYVSFKVDVNGLHTNPVVSETGILFSMGDNNYSLYSELVASPDGKMLATASPRNSVWNFPGGVEMYDFEKCSGKVKNARVFDVGNNNYGVAFSPDNSKLYVQSNLPITTPFQPLSQTEHNLYQFDLSLQSINAIENSKTLVLSNPMVERWAPFCPAIIGWLGTMRIGPDDKLYFTNGQPQVCPSTAGLGMTLHVINSPNASGLACNPITNAIYNFQNGMSVNLTRDNLPREIVLPPTGSIDTNVNPVIERMVCFKNTDTIFAPLDVSCVEWSTGSTDSVIVVSESGKYWIRYFKDCTVYVDTFDISFSKLPEIATVQYGCPGNIMLQAGETSGNPFAIDVYNDMGGKVQGNEYQSLHQITSLDAGIYSLKIINGACDTTLEVELKAYPLPQLNVDPNYAKIQHGEEVTLKGSGALYYIWTPQQYLNSFSTQEVIARPRETTKFMMVGINDYGCRDTTYVMVEVSHDKQIPMPNAFTPNGDGLNDLFKIPYGAFIIRKFEIYNRYGEMVYLDNGNNRGWDGRYNGKFCDVGVYHYVIILDFGDNTERIIKGDVSLIR